MCSGRLASVLYGALAHMEILGLDLVEVQRGSGR
jgi:hypothetical protein